MSLRPSHNSKWLLPAINDTCTVCWRLKDSSEAFYIVWLKFRLRRHPSGATEKPYHWKILLEMSLRLMRSSPEPVVQSQSSQVGSYVIREKKGPGRWPNGEEHGKKIWTLHLSLHLSHCSRWSHDDNAFSMSWLYDENPLMTNIYYILLISPISVIQAHAESRVT